MAANMLNLDGWGSLSARERADRITEAFRAYTMGDEAAVDYLNGMFYFIHAWDDIIDGDKPRHDDEINRAMMWALIDVHANPFFDRHRYFLITINTVYVNQWLDANEFEKAGAAGLERAFALRDTSIDLISQVAGLIGGHEWKRAVAADMRRLLMINETLKQWMEEKEHG